MPRRGEEFERTIFQFYRGRDANCEVTFDHRVPDRDTGEPRQVDVWVRARLLGNMVFNILISCKDHRRLLDVGEVESLMGEMRSTGANAGVLYSPVGFTKQALVKAGKNGITCCKWCEGEPPELPADLPLEAFVAVPTYQIKVLPIGLRLPSASRWDSVLSATVERMRLVPSVQNKV
jgi:hypothetical protein